MMFAALPPSSSVSLLPVPASSRWIALPTSVEPVKAILSTPSDFHERGSRPAVAGDDVHHSRRQLRLPQHVREEKRGQRRRFRGLEDDGVARGQSGRDLPREHQQREVPRDDLPRHADGARSSIGKRVLELVGPARVVEEVRGGEREVDVAGLLDRLAAVQRLQHGELARALLKDPRDAEEVLRPLGGCDARPAVLERLARRSDRPLDFLGSRLADLCERLLGRG